MLNLQTTYMGLELKNPLLASASPLSKKLDNLRAMEDAGLSGVVLYSLFEEQIIHDSLELDHFLMRGSFSSPEAVSYFPDLQNYNMGPEIYLELIQKAKKVVKIPVIASLNGISTGGWVKYAQLMEEAGADALELNIYYLPTDKNLSSSQMEDVYLDLVKSVAVQVKIPLAVKLSPSFTSLPNFVQKLADAKVKGVVLFNRFYQPDLDIENLSVTPTLNLSTSADLLLPLRWIAILYGRVPIDFALTSGVHSGEDALKAMMSGARAAMLASELISKGILRVKEILEEMRLWMEKHEYESIHQLQGSLSQQKVEEPAAFERANYMKALNKFDNGLLK
jgi:dihydroorotate dehydrogenase (fumarate)